MGLEEKGDLDTLQGLDTINVGEEHSFSYLTESIDLSVWLEGPRSDVPEIALSSYFHT
jgi:hypothetical protein